MEPELPAEESVDTISVDDAEDTTLTLVPVTSMKVGIFRRCR